MFKLVTIFFPEKIVLGPVELASAGVSVSIFNIISKIFNIPLLSVTTSFVAEDISKTTSKQFIWYIIWKRTIVFVLISAKISSQSWPSFGGLVGNDLEDDELMDKHVSFVKSEKLRLPSVSSALLLAAAIGTFEALALFFGATLFLNLMGISPVSS